MFDYIDSHICVRFVKFNLTKLLGVLFVTFLYLYRNLPRANILAVLIVTSVYLLVNISYFTVLSGPELLKSAAVANVSVKINTIIILESALLNVFRF